MNINHRRTEIIIAIISLIGFLYIIFSLFQPGVTSAMTEIEFTIQFTTLVTFLTAITFTAASYAGMFYAQERFGKDIIYTIISLNMGINAYFHMISHRGSYFGGFFELSVSKSNLFILMGFLTVILGLMVAARYDAKSFSKRGELGTVIFGIVMLPLTSIFILFQPIQVYLLNFDQNLLGTIAALGIIFAILMALIALIMNVRVLMKRKNVVPTGAFLLLVFIILSLVLRILQGATWEIWYQPLELIGITSSLFGYLVFAIALLGTSMIDPHWRK